MEVHPEFTIIGGATDPGKSWKLDRHQQTLRPRQRDGNRLEDKDKLDGLMDPSHAAASSSSELPPVRSIHLSPTSPFPKNKEPRPLGEGLVDPNGVSRKLTGGWKVTVTIMVRIKAMKRLSIQTTYLSVFSLMVPEANEE